MLQLQLLIKRVDLQGRNKPASIDIDNIAVVAETANTKSDAAVVTSNEANSKSDITQSQLNEIVIEGDSSVEAAQARVDTEGIVYPDLRERLNAKRYIFSISNKRCKKEFPKQNINPKGRYSNAALISFISDDGRPSDYTVLNLYLVLTMHLLLLQ